MRNLGAWIPYTGEKAPCCILGRSKHGGIICARTIIAYVLQNEDHPDCFVIYEVYRSKEDFLFHRKTPHAQKWKAETEPILAKPRARIRRHSLYFSG